MRWVGLEPTHPKALASKTSLATNYNTSAWFDRYQYTSLRFPSLVNFSSIDLFMLKGCEVFHILWNKKVGACFKSSITFFHFAIRTQRATGLIHEYVLGKISCYFYRTIGIKNQEYMSPPNPCQNVQPVQLPG